MLTPEKQRCAERKKKIISLIIIHRIVKDKFNKTNTIFIH